MVLDRDGRFVAHNIETSVRNWIAKKLLIRRPKSTTS